MTIYSSERDLKENLERITRRQQKQNTFVNVSVKDYRGSKYPAGTKVIKIG